jgi:hypothetical protein
VRANSGIVTNNFRMTHRKTRTTGRPCHRPGHHPRPRRDRHVRAAKYAGHDAIRYSVTVPGAYGNWNRAFSSQHRAAPESNLHTFRAALFSLSITEAALDFFTLAGNTNIPMPNRIKCEQNSKERSEQRRWPAAPAKEAPSA